MDPRTAARLLAVNRIGIGTALVLVPRLAGRGWIGPDSALEGAQLFGRALGARDIALGAGMYEAVRKGASVRPWALAATLADGVDLVATLLARRALPPSSQLIGISMTGGSTAIAAWLSAALD